VLDLFRLASPRLPLNIVDRDPDALPAVKEEVPTPCLSDLTPRFIYLFLNKFVVSINTVLG
jgi:hypothetical protein